ncbi:hypothetical protein ANCCEY_13140 [Ancylostoma ceylanicum]|uniref:SCP domain-containing protein n=1 Tax=Ancylostoma ceylanicum TaxID=53326 RepID=A0A0D6LJJ5_9BILA|nr:hypothetical protein ANCCEY_13140 [Ancylostoma ceylanicum]
MAASLGWDCNMEIQAHEQAVLCATATPPQGFGVIEAKRLLATGWAEDNKITYAKPAKAMFELTYEKSLEEAANKYITNNNGNCPEKAENADLTGENFYVDKNFQLTNEEVIQKAMQQWWSPLKMKGFGDNLQYDNIQDNDVKALANLGV